MAIGAIAGAEGTFSDQPADQTCNVPAGTANGDLLVAYAALTQDDTVATAITAAGWIPTQFARTAAPAGRSAVLVKVYNSSTDPAPGNPVTFSKDGGFNGTFGVCMIKIPGADSTLAVAPAEISQAAQSTAVQCPATDVPAGLPDQALVVRCYHTYYYSATKPNTDTWLPPANYVEQADQSNDWLSLGIATRLVAAGAEAAAAATAGGSTNGAYGRGVTLVVAPAAISSGPEPGRRMLSAVS